LKVAPRGNRIGVVRPSGEAQSSAGRIPTRRCRMSNLTIANIFLFLAILCMALSFSAGLYLYYVYSIAATVMAGAVRHQQMPHNDAKRN
jgi:fatty acid desaturase